MSARQRFALALDCVDDLHRTARKGVLALKRQLGVSAEVGRQPHSFSDQQRQHDQSELVERPKRVEGLDRARSSDEVDIAALVDVPKPLEEFRRIAVDDYVVRCG